MVKSHSRVVVHTDSRSHARGADSVRDGWVSPRCLPVPLASQKASEAEEDGGQREEGSKPTQLVPTGSVRGGDAGFDGIQPRGLCPVSTHLVSESRRALGDAGFAASDAQEVGDARLGVGRQGQELGVEKARLEDGGDGTPSAHEILDAGLHSAAVHQPTAVGARRCGVVDLLSCGRHHNPLSSSRRTWGKGGRSPVRGRHEGSRPHPSNATLRQRAMRRLRVGRLATQGA
jgi:hypothetical protein